MSDGEIAEGTVAPEAPVDTEDAAAEALQGLFFGQEQDDDGGIGFRDSEPLEESTGESSDSSAGTPAEEPGDGEGEGEREEDEEDAASDSAEEEGDSDEEEKPEDTEDTIEEARAKLSKHWGVLEKRQAKFKRSVERFRTERREWDALRNHHMAQLDRLRNGDTRSALEAIAQLSNKDPATFVSDINELLVNDGPAQRQTAPEIQELKQEITRLREERQAEKLGAAQNHEMTELAKMSRDESSYPILSKLDQGEVANAAHQVLIQHYQQTGEVAPLGQALEFLEQQEKTRYESVRGVLSPPQPSSRDVGQVTDSAQAPNNPGGVRRPLKRGESLTPGVASQSHGSTRQLTDEERMAQAAALLDGMGMG